MICNDIYISSIIRVAHTPQTIANHAAHTSANPVAISTAECLVNYGTTNVFLPSCVPLVPRNIYCRFYFILVTREVGLPSGPWTGPVCAREQLPNLRG